jgi:hypothetical protein
VPGIMADGMQPYLETIEHLNVIQERPFVEENCTMFVERAVGKRRMFADSPTGRLLGVDLRVGDPASLIYCQPVFQGEYPAGTIV